MVNNINKNWVMLFIVETINSRPMWHTHGSSLWVATLLLLSVYEKDRLSLLEDLFFPANFILFYTLHDTFKTIIEELDYMDEIFS